MYLRITFWQKKENRHSAPHASCYGSKFVQNPKIKFIVQAFCDLLQFRFD